MILLSCFSAGSRLLLFLVTSVTDEQCNEFIVTHRIWMWDSEMCCARSVNVRREHREHPSQQFPQSENSGGTKEQARGEHHTPSPTEGCDAPPAVTEHFHHWWYLEDTASLQSDAVSPSLSLCVYVPSCVWKCFVATNNSVSGTTCVCVCVFPLVIAMTVQCVLSLHSVPEQTASYDEKLQSNEFHSSFTFLLLSFLTVCLRRPLLCFMFYCEL